MNSSENSHKTLRDAARIRKVRDLREFLDSNSLSPEMLAVRTSISNMTIRRLLAHSNGTGIPEKYHAQLDQLTHVPSSSAQHNAVLNADMHFLFAHLEKLASQSEIVAKGLVTRAKVYVKSCEIGQILLAPIRRLGQYATNGKSPSYRTLAIGALVYFITPLDFIPDITAVTGFLDDYAILSLVDMWIEAQAALEATSAK